MSEKRPNHGTTSEYTSYSPIKIRKQRNELRKNLDYYDISIIDKTKNINHLLVCIEIQWEGGRVI